MMLIQLVMYIHVLFGIIFYFDIIFGIISHQKNKVS